MITRQQIVDAARAYIGTPFKKGGRDANGMDCVGLLILTGTDCGLALRDSTAYNFDPNVPLMEEYVFKQSTRQKIVPLQNGYIAILKQSVFPMHTGIITMDGPKPTIINANMKARRVIEEDLSYWINDLISVRDYLGVV